jgi:radical SAM protein with 4Fe4S-binding SPASM domain
VPAKRVAVPERVPCVQLWFNMVILRSGEVALCCYDYDGRTILGDIRTQSIQNVWQGPKYREMRELHRRARYDEVALCKSCHGTYDTKSAPAWWRP